MISGGPRRRTAPRHVPGDAATAPTSSGGAPPLPGRVRVGQVWQDRTRRWLVVERIAGTVAITHTLKDGEFRRRAQVRLDRFGRDYRLVEEAVMTHAFPPEGSILMPCCGRTPWEVPREDRMTPWPSLVSCGEEPQA